VNTPLCVIHAASVNAAEIAAERVRGAYKIGQTEPDVPPVVYRRVG